MKKILMVNDETVTSWNGKQDKINDLETIRSGAAAGATAVQPSSLNSYATETELNTHTGNTGIHVTSSDKTSWTGKQDKLVGSGTGQNIKTINNQTILGSGNITITSGTTYTEGKGISISNNTLNASSTLVGSTTVSSISSIPVSNRMVLANISANGAMTFSSQPSDGFEVHVIVHNTGSGVISITLPSSGNYICTSENTVYIDSGKYGEVNACTIGTTTFIRGINSI